MTADPRTEFFADLRDFAARAVGYGHISYTDLQALYLAVTVIETPLDDISVPAATVPLTDCPSCGGDGDRDSEQGDLIRGGCRTCHGRGQVPDWPPRIPDLYTLAPSTRPLPDTDDDLDAHR